MVKFFYYVFYVCLFVNAEVIASGKSGTRYDATSCVSPKVDAITSNIKARKKEIPREYNCGVMGIGVVQKIPYHENFNPIHVVISSVCVRCGMCLVIADKINKTLMTLHDTPSFDRWLENPEVEIILGRLCRVAFLRYRLREIDGERYIGENVPGSKIIETTADGSWAKNLKEKCEEVMTTVGLKKIYKFWKEGCKGYNRKLTEILCYGKMGILRDCRGISINK